MIAAASTVNLIPVPGPGTAIGPIDIPIAIGIILTAFVLIGIVGVGLEAFRKHIHRTSTDHPATRADLTLVHAHRH